MTTRHPLTGTAGALQALARTRKENRKAMERLTGAMEAVAGFKKQHDEQMISILYSAFNQQ